MHYKNGREAKNGDKVVLVPSWGPPVIGILYDATVGNNTCNGKLAHLSPSDPCPDLSACLHLEDVLAALPTEVPNTSVKPRPTIEELESILNSESEAPITVQADGSITA